MTSREVFLTRSGWLLAWAALLVPGGCERKPPAPAPETDRGNALLLAQAQFVDEYTPEGKKRVLPGAAKLVIVRPDGDQWIPEVLEDPDSNVFHKAMPFTVPGEQPGILTIGAAKTPLPATVKVWRRGPEGWTGTVLWAAQVGRVFSRFRDVEIGDVTGDGKLDLVIGTHDQGIVAVLEKKGDTWASREIDRQPGVVIVHEIEIGDVDGDGRNEIFATPSARNRADGGAQPGLVVMYRYDGARFSREVVDDFGDRHAREILVADVEGTGSPTLYAAVEVVLRGRGRPAGPRPRLEIRQYRFTPGGITGTVIATLPDSKCRFLNAGDVDGDGQGELIASAFKSGIWMIKPREGEWASQLIDGESGGYQHATALADMDGDGRLEIYAATDDGQKLRRYRWNGEKFERTDLLDLVEGDMTWGLMPCVDARHLAVQPRGRGDEPTRGAAGAP